MTDRFCIDTQIYDSVDLPVEDQFENIAKAGFKNVFFSIKEIHDGSAFPEIAKAARAAGLRIVNVHLPFRSNELFWLEGEKRQARLEKFYKYIDIVGGVGGVESVVIHPTAGEDNLYVSDIGTDSFKKLCKRAAKYNMDVCIENLRAREHLDWLFEKVNEPNLKFVHDTGHEVAFTKGTDHLKYFGKHLGFTHIHDNDGISDLHLIPGKGVIDLKTVMSKYHKLGYNGYLSLEVCVWPKYFPNKEEHLQYVKEAFNAITAMNIY